MLTERHYPLFLTHAELDEYLARGWYRMNQMIFTCHFIYFNEGIFSPVWIRLSLQDYQFRKSLQGLMKRNAQYFRYETHPAKITAEKEALFQAYKAHFKGHLADSLRDALMDNTNINIYDTQEICVYKGDQLVAISFFDKGASSLASIMGIYDPAYAKYSLGFYTMLLEIVWGIQYGKKYYYPGYVIPGRPRFDYKLRIGEVDYYDPGSNYWKNYKELTSEQLPIRVLQNQLNSLRKILLKQSIPVKRLFYPLFEEELLEYQNQSFLKYPICLSCFHRDDNTYPMIIEYDLMNKKFVLSRYNAVESLLTLFTNELADRYGVDTCCLSFLYKDMILEENADPHLICEAVLQYS